MCVSNFLCERVAHFPEQLAADLIDNRIAILSIDQDCNIFEEIGTANHKLTHILSDW